MMRFFFQAEDGIRDVAVTGVQTCALPIYVGPDFPGVSNIRINYQSGIRQGVQHLAALGHRQIAFITGPLNLKSAQARRSAFEKSMEEISLVPGLIVEGDHTMEGGMRLLTQLVESRIRPTAVMC